MTTLTRTPRLAPTADLTPARLRKLMLRLAQALQPGQGYTITIFVLDGDQEPVHTVTPLGKLENYCSGRMNVLE
jgi:hypothetical protein